MATLLSEGEVALRLADAVAQSDGGETSPAVTDSPKGPKRFPLTSTVVDSLVGFIRNPTERWYLGFPEFDLATRGVGRGEVAAAGHHPDAGGGREKEVVRRREMDAVHRVRIEQRAGDDNRGLVGDRGSQINVELMGALAAACQSPRFAEVGRLHYLGTDAVLPCARVADPAVVGEAYRHRGG